MSARQPVLGKHQERLLKAVIAAGRDGTPIEAPVAGLDQNDRSMAIRSLVKRGFLELLRPGAGRRQALVRWTGKDRGDGLTDLQRAVLALIADRAELALPALGSTSMAFALALGGERYVVQAIQALERKGRLVIRYENRRTVYEVLPSGKRTAPGPIALSAPRKQRCLTPLTRPTPVPVPDHVAWPFRGHRSQAELMQAEAAD